MANGKNFNFTINADAVARELKEDVALTVAAVQEAAQDLTIQAHAKVLEFASQDLKGFQLQLFLGKNRENVRWSRASENLWVVEIDESVGYFDSGRPPVSMATEQWLLKNAKTAKDGSKYKVIPIGRDTGKGGASHGTTATLNTMAKNAIRSARTSDNKRIAIHRIEKNPDGTPKIGILHKIPIKAPFSQSQTPNLYSKPRSKEDAAKSGLKEHGGIFKLEGLAISQRMVGGKVKREAVTFRVVSSKHLAEGRWMAPAIKAGNFLQRTFDWATKQAWPEMLAGISDRINKQGKR